MRTGAIGTQATAPGLIPAPAPVSDDDFEAAIAASIAESRASISKVEIDNHKESVKGDVRLHQHNTLNQFHTFFAASISRYEAPSAICGYMTIAHCRLLRKHLEGAPSPLPLSALEAAGSALIKEKAQVLIEVERAMSSIHAKRTRYVESHPGVFDAAERRKYMQAWVANYEISDELVEDGMPLNSAAAERAPSLHFARYNEYPSLGEATYEERERIAADQQRFGGRMGAKGESVFSPGDSVHIFERFEDGGKSQLLTVAEWRMAEEEGVCTSSPRIFAVDLNGHFVTAVVCYVASGDGSEARPVVYVFNTTESSYLEWPMLTDLHGIVFKGSYTAPPGAAGASTGAGATKAGCFQQ